MTNNESDNLNFDEAVSDESSGGVPICASCKAPQTTSYYTANDQVLCENCKATIVGVTSGTAGSSSRFVRALAIGVGAAIVGAAIYFAVLWITGYEVGLIAVVVGFLIGKGVNIGSHGRGGWVYQTMAVGLTYCAIVSTYVPIIIREVWNNPTQFVAATDSVETALSAAMDSAAANATVLDGAMVPDTDTTPSQFTDDDLTVPTALVGMAVLFLIAAASPILAGFSNIIGLIIIGFALFEAWKLNQKPQITFKGPFRVGSTTSEEHA